jgi:hypothetical protein
VPSNV